MRTATLPTHEAPSSLTIEMNRDQSLIARECDAIKEMLLEKNRRYSSSAFYPARIFSKSDAIEQINVRIDDKLTRIRNMGPQAEDEDTELDLTGYLILRRVLRKILAMEAMTS